MARGFSQQYGLAKITTVRVLLALAASKSWKLWQIDVSLLAWRIASRNIHGAATRVCLRVKLTLTTSVS